MLLEDWKNAYLNRDFESLERIIADDWTYSGSPDGTTSMKRKSIDGFKNADYRFVDVVFSDLKIRTFGNVTIITAVEELTIKGKDGEPTKLKLRFTDAYRKENDKIPAISTLSSPVKN